MYWEFDWLMISAYPASVKPITVGATVNERDNKVLITDERGTDVAKQVAITAKANIAGNKTDLSKLCRV